MRQTITGLVAGLAFAVTVAAAPAQACEVTSPCGQGSYHGANQSYGLQQEALPDPNGPQYYYVNHGPTYSGPGNLAPAPTYQERAVSGWQGYSRPYYYRYNGGPYGNATSHLYDGAPDVRGPVVYSYRPRHTHFRPHRVGPKYYYTSRPSFRYGYRAHRGYAVRSGYGPRFYAQPTMHGPRMRHMPQYAAPRYRPGQKPERTYKF